MTWTMLVAVDLLCALAGYSFLAYALARLRWSGRGLGLALLAIIIAAQTWLIPQVLCAFVLGLNLLVDWFWFANWLVCAFGIVLLWHVLKDIPSDRADAARMDGCNAFGIYWRVVLPFVRQTFLLLAILILVATGGFLLARPSLVLHAGTRSSDFPFLIAASVATTLPLIAIFFLARQIFPARKFSDRL